MIRRYLWLLPPFGLFAVLACVYLVTVAADYITVDTDTSKPAIRLLLLCVWTGFHAIRPCASHPGLRSKYRQWLAFTTWTHRKPLPEGQPNLSWFDFLALGLVTLIAYINQAQDGTTFLDHLSPMCWLIPLMVFFGIYNLAMFFAMIATVPSAAVLLIFMPFVVFPHLNLIIALGVLLIFCAYLHWCHYQYLRGFPWNQPEWKFDPMRQLRKDSVAKLSPSWPYTQLRKIPEGHDVVDEHGNEMGKWITITAWFGMSLLATWWLHVIVWTVAMFDDGVDRGNPLLVLLIPIIIIPTISLGIYCNGLSPPITLFGRMLTGRLIIPKFDKIFVAPICVVAIGFGALITCSVYGWINIWSGDIIFFAVLFLTLVLPPDYKRWRLTGMCRIDKPVRKTKSTKTTGTKPIALPGLKW